jgi:hypothetical protein
VNRTLFGQSISFLASFLTPALIAGAVLSTTVVQVKADPPATEETTTQEAATKQSPQSTETKQNDKDWKPLTGSWVVSQFGGDGPVEITDNLIKFGYGDPLTGIRWEGDVLRENYELELEARRTDGFDFFCGLTFPVGKNNVSFILGGWGGGVVGISSVDGRDASENDTTSFRNFDNDKWYKVRVRVEPNEIRCWIDDKAAAEQIRQGHEFDIRYEMDQSVPMGVAAFQCKTELRNIRIRKLTEKELAEANKRSPLKPEAATKENSSESEGAVGPAGAVGKQDAVGKQGTSGK